MGDVQMLDYLILLAKLVCQLGDAGVAADLLNSAVGKQLQGLIMLSSQQHDMCMR